MLGNTMDHELSLDVMFTSNGSISVVVVTNDNNKQYTIHYLTTRLTFLQFSLVNLNPFYVRNLLALAQRHMHGKSVLRNFKYCIVFSDELTHRGLFVSF